MYKKSSFFFFFSLCLLASLLFRARCCVCELSSNCSWWVGVLLIEYVEQRKEGVSVVDMDY